MFGTTIARNLLRAMLVAAAALAAVVSVSTMAAPPAGDVGAIVVRFRDGVVPAGTALPADLRDAIAATLGTRVVDGGATRDGAFKLLLDPALQLDAARAGINRVRMDPDLLYANIAPVAIPPADPAMAALIASRSLPTNRIIVRYKDPVRVGWAQANLPMEQAQLTRLGTLIATPLAFVRNMGSGAQVLQMLRRLPVAEVEAMAALIAQQPDIDFAQADHIDQIQLAASDPCYASASTVECVNGYQWDLFEATGGVNIQPAWDITTGSSSIYVGVIDTGALFSHPDLVNRYQGSGYDMVADYLVANDGAPAQPGGCNPAGVLGNPLLPPCVSSRDADAADPGDWLDPIADQLNNGSSWFYGCGTGSNSSWHGTHVAGTIGAQANNGIGIAGINWVSRIVPVRVLGKCGGYESDIADAITWASGGTVPGTPANATPARALNLSIGGARAYGNCGDVYQAAITDALTRKTVVSVSAGNSNIDAGYSAPANCNGIVTVASTGQTGYKAYYSNYNYTGLGNYVEIAAPGGDMRVNATYNPTGRGILSSLNAGTQAPGAMVYREYQGTSMASPHIAGIASLMLSARPTLSASQVIALMQSTARAFPTGALACALTSTSSAGSSSGWFACQCNTTLCGAGIVNAGAAVLAAYNDGTTTTDLVTNLNPATSGSGVTLTATVVGSTPTGNVAFKDGGVDITGCAAVALTGTGNSRTAQCATPALSVGTHSMTAAYAGAGNNSASISAPLAQVVVAPLFLRTRDFNADGRYDLSWRNAATGQTAIWLMNGTIYASYAIVLADLNWSVTHTADLSGDGRSDLIWRHTSGMTTAWLMNGTAYTLYATLVSDPAWSVVRTGDFNGDGRSDLVWRNSTTGQTAIWLMNGLAPIASAIVLADMSWQVTNVGDFNGDGRSDLVWRNSTTGQTAIWLMNGTTPSAGAVVLADPLWQVTHVGDFNGDGRSDLVWRNSTTGQTAVWLMNGLAPTGSAAIFSDPNWQVTNVGDLNGDSRADLVWRNGSTGATALWLMNGLASAGTTVALADPNWRVTHVGDTNADGRSDLVWRNSVTGATTIWLMNGLAYSSYGTPLVDLNWQVSPADGL